MKSQTVYFNNQNIDQQYIRIRESQIQNNNPYLNRLVEFEQQKIKIQNLLNKNVTFNPENKIIVVWNIINFLCIYMYFFEIPIILAYNQNYSEIAVLGTNIILLLVFMINVAIRLKTSFYRNGILIDDSRQIIKNYFTFGFYIDIVTIASMLPPQIQRLKYLQHYEQFRQKKLVNLLSLLFYFKVFQIDNMVKLINKSLQLNRRSKAFFNLLLLMLNILVICTIYGSLFFSISRASCDSYNNGCWIMDNNDGPGQAPLILNDDTIGWYQQYGFSLYWASTTMLSIGYGDLTPKNTPEVYFTVLAQFSSCVLYGYSLNKIWQIKKELEYIEEKYQKKSNIINRYMRDKKVSTQLKSKVNAYLGHYYIEKRDKQSENQIINELAPLLKEQLLMQVYGFIFKKFKIFATFTQQFLIQISEQVNQIRYSQNEIIYEIDNDQIDHSLHFIFTGEIQIYLELEQKKKIIKRLPQKRLFGVYQFFTDLEGITRANATRYTSIYQLKSSIWSAKIFNFDKDFEEYHQIRALAKYENNMQPIHLKCDFCGSYTHITQKCSYSQLKKNYYKYIKNYRLQKNSRSLFYREKLKLTNMKINKNSQAWPKFFNDLSENHANSANFFDDSNVSLRQYRKKKIEASKNNQAKTRKYSVQSDQFVKLNKKQMRYKEKFIKQQISQKQDKNEIIQQKKEKKNDLLGYKTNDQKIQGKVTNTDRIYQFSGFFNHFNITNIIFKCNRNQ